MDKYLLFMSSSIPVPLSPLFSQEAKECTLTYNKLLTVLFLAKCVIPMGRIITGLSSAGPKDRTDVGLLSSNVRASSSSHRGLPAVASSMARRGTTTEAKVLIRRSFI